jgi:hypothetical protein
LVSDKIEGEDIKRKVMHIRFGQSYKEKWPWLELSIGGGHDRSCSCAGHGELAGKVKEGEGEREQVVSFFVASMRRKRRKEKREEKRRKGRKKEKKKWGKFSNLEIFAEKIKDNL